MREGRIGARAGATADELRRGLVTFEPRTGREDALYAQALALREGIPSIIWVVLVLGGAVTVFFTHLLGVSTGRLHVVMIVAYTLVLALIPFTIRAFDYPFDRLVQVGPGAFEAALSRTESRVGW